MAPPNRTLASLIARARDPAASIADRHEAFGELVRRFQDVAIASAYARLRDHALAQDAAQDAFLTAWERLHQLREPEAFPGWILRLVFTQCHRRLRCRRLPMMSDDDAEALAAAAPSIERDAAHDSRLLQRALSALAASDRLVLSLFYGSERSHRQIADWLGVPVTTVARRLAHAKRRLQKVAFELLSDRLRADRQLASESFAMELSARLRPADCSDALEITSLATRLEIECTHHVPASTPTCAYVVEDPEAHVPIAYAAATRTIFEPIYQLQLAIGEAAIQRHAGDALLIQVIEDLQARRAIAVRHHTSSRHAALVQFLRSRGFEVVQRAQDWRLAAGARVVAPAMHPAWEFRNIKALGEQPALFDAALELVTSTAEEDPAARPFLPIHAETFRRFLRTQRDGVIAMRRGTIQALIGASADDVMPRGWRVDVLVVRHRWRRRGLATALLHRLLGRGRGAPARLVARERGDLTAWLTRCGFVHVTDALLLERLLRPTVRVAPERLDEYVGHYMIETGGGTEPIAIERFGDSLVSKSRDMRDLLLASSDREFFTRHHYGEGRFERDDSGRVARLVVTEGARKVVAVRS